jgi:hypothetical protein
VVRVVTSPSAVKYNGSWTIMVETTKIWPF